MATCVSCFPTSNAIWIRTVRFGKNCEHYGPRNFNGFNTQPQCSLIKGDVCGVRVEEIEDPLVQKAHYMGRPIDELARGKSMEKLSEHKTT
ncbi:MAG: DUF2200 family protein [Pseudomonadota bacterium]